MSDIIRKDMFGRELRCGKCNETFQMNESFSVGVSPITFSPAPFHQKCVGPDTEEHREHRV